MKESQISINLYDLNKRYLELYYSVGVYEEYKSIKKINSIILKYIFGGRFKELISLAKGFFCRGKKKNQCIENTVENIEFPENVKVVVYTCIAGEYDTVKEPMYVNERLCNFVAITDCAIPQYSQWKRMNIADIKEMKDLSPSMKNRYAKLHPHVLFPEYDYSVYVDGSITVVADVMPLIGKLVKNNAWLGVHNMSNGIDCIYDEAVSVIGAKKAPKDIVEKQVAAYKKEGYPRHNGLFENTILVRKHNDPHCMKVMDDWWEQLLTFSQRDQMSFNYVLWKNNIAKKEICILGNNLYRNPRFYWQPHNEYFHKKKV